jgi:stearoyl-CoA desaturase (delta-9 desaturase)
MSQHTESAEDSALHLHPEVSPMRRFVIGFMIVATFLAAFYALLLVILELAFGMDTINMRNVMIFVIFHFACMFGISAGYHRYAVHHAYDAAWPIRMLILILGSMAVQGKVEWWAKTHHHHHRHVETDEDPHSPLKGFWSSHCGWLLSRRRDPDHELHEDWVIVFVSRTFPIWAFLGLYLPYALGGWNGFLWGGLVRLFFGYHLTWLINSACHIPGLPGGYRNYNTKDDSQNNWIIALLGNAEAWHNNHHAKWNSFNQGNRWWEIDWTVIVLSAFWLLGWAVKAIAWLTWERLRPYRKGYILWSPQWFTGASIKRRQMALARNST